MNILLYSKTGCTWSQDVISFLKGKHIPFEEREVLGNSQYFDELVIKSGQSKTPTLDIDGHIIANADIAQVSSYLREKGIGV